MSKIKNGGLNQYGAEPFEQQQLGTAGTEGVKLVCSNVNKTTSFKTKTKTTSLKTKTKTEKFCLKTKTKT